MLNTHPMTAAWLVISAAGLLALVAPCRSEAADPPSVASNGPPPPDENPRAARRRIFRPDQLIVKLAAGQDGLDLSDGSELSAVLLRYGAREQRRAFRGPATAPGAIETAQDRAGRARRRFPERAGRSQVAAAVPDLENVFLVQLERPTDVLQAIAELAALPGIAYAEPNALFDTLQQPLPDEPLIPDDRYLSEDGVNWSEGSWGQAFFDLWGLEKLAAIEAWNLFDLNASGGFDPGETRPGEGVIVAVIDTGLDSQHPDIEANLWRNAAEIAGNQIDDDSNGFVDDAWGWDFVAGDEVPEDRFGHGTHVAGTVAARGDNGIGVIGVAPWARVMPIKGLDDSGVGDAVTLANAVVYAADMGADVISASWGSLLPSETIEEAFAYADGLGVVSVAAAGNTNSNVTTPANLDDVIAVAASDADDVKAPFSNHGSEIDVSAPGVEILSLNANAGDNALADARPGQVIGGDYLHLRGTSMACPHASGAVAVLLSRYVDDTAYEIRGRLIAGSESIAAQNPGFEARLGHGRVELRASLVAEAGPVMVLVDVEQTGAVPGRDGAISVSLENLWEGASEVHGILSTTDPRAVVRKREAEFGDIPAGQLADNRADPFEVSLAVTAEVGDDIPFELALAGANGYAERLGFELHITHFVDVSERVGLPVFNFIPWGVGIQDYDADGAPDAQFIGGFGGSQLFRNEGEQFAIDRKAGVVTPGVGTAQQLFLDVDNDGDQDLFVAGFNNTFGSQFYLNAGDGTFTDVTDAAGVRGLRAFAAAAFDYDGDGLVDFLGSAQQNEGLTRPEGLFLMRNNGDHTFTDVGPQTCINTRLGLVNGQALTLDHDNDGDSDLLLASIGEVSLYRNNGDGTYSDVTVNAGLTPFQRVKGACRAHSAQARRPRCEPSVAMGAAIGDYDNDGDVDLFLTGRSQGPIDRFHSLYENDGFGSFTDVTDWAGDLAEGGISGIHWGNAFFDYDNDGDLDLYVTNEGRTRIKTNTLYQNDGGGQFNIVTDLAFPSDTGPSAAAAAIGDYNLDGALDIYAPAGALGSGGDGAFFENRSGLNNHFLVVKLRGVVSHRDAYGARISVKASGLSQLRDHHTSPVDPRSVHFGLGGEDTIDEVQVRWPSGIVQRVVGAQVDRMLEITEPAKCVRGAEHVEFRGSEELVFTTVECPDPRAVKRKRRTARFPDDPICVP